MAVSPRRVALGGFALPALTAVALILASPPHGVWPLVFVAFVPMVVAQNELLPARWSGLGLAVGVGGYLVWTLNDTFLPSQRWWFVPLIGVLYVSGRVSRLCWDSTGRGHLWSDPVVWTATLFLLGLTPIASWIDPAYDLYQRPWLVQPISLVGMAGLNLLVMLVNYAIAGWWMASRQMKVRTATATAALLVVWVGSSVLMFANLENGSSVRVAVVQPGLTDLKSPAGAAARAKVADTTLTRLEAATRQAAQRGAQLVVWPEKVLRYVDPEADLGDRLGTLVGAANIYLVVGYTEDPDRFNRATLVTPGGTFTLVYDKVHPVTFQGDHSIGGPVRVTETRLGRIAPIICYDLDYPQTARAAVDAGAQLLAVPSWDWSGIAEQHYAHLVFRAIENQVPAAKADTAWDSAIVDSDGRIKARKVSPEGETAVLVATVHLGEGPTLYTRTGDLLGWGSVALAALWGFVAAYSVLGRRKDLKLGDG
jgi:apolipoprotein N-acyltransferase